MKTKYYLFAWSTKVTTVKNSEGWRNCYYSLRPVNNPSNSIEHNKYDSRQGRNIAIKRLLEKYPKGAIKVIRNTDPKKFLKDRK